MRENFIVAVITSEDSFGYGSIPRVIASDHPRFVVGTRFDYGFLGNEKFVEFALSHGICNLCRVHLRARSRGRFSEIQKQGEKMPKVGTLADLIYDAVAPKLPRLVPEAMAREQLNTIVNALTSSGWNILPPGTVLPVPRRDVKIEPASFFCPYCGEHKPGYGVSPMEADVPGFGKLQYVTIFYACCRTAMQMIVTGSQQAPSAVQ